MIVALAGGVGAARFLRGLVRVVDPASVTVIVNTADDDRFHGLAVSPDLDTVTYTLAGAEHPEQGWGLADESFRVMDALDRYGEATWFRLGDRDLATHLFRTRRLEEGATLTEVTAEIARAWGVGPRLLPMSDDRVATRVTVRRPDGTTEVLAMQEWFVRERTGPPVVEVAFAGADDARAGPDVLAAIDAADTILVCPSNPVISIGPIVAVPGIRDALVARRDRVVGVSPIIAGAPVRGPADRLMDPLGIEVSCVGVARAYAEFCGTLVIDTNDAARRAEVEAAGLQVVVADTLMRDARVAAALAQHTLDAVA
jgi:LPPG:FO 2-phospho-L-lactate transferase